ncbi:MAG: hypothetical protein ACR2OR_07000 [Hyphomicrobiales bacterium]
MSASSALAHGWYDRTCCSDNDCRPANPGEVVGVDGGYEVVVGEVRYRVANRDTRVRPSLDGGFHVCIINQFSWSDGGGIVLDYPHLQCLYVPKSGV